LIISVQVRYFPIFQALVTVNKSFYLTTIFADDRSLFDIEIGGKLPIEQFIDMYAFINSGPYARKSQFNARFDA